MEPFLTLTACENVVPNQRMPMAGLNKVIMNGNFKTRNCPKPKLGHNTYGYQGHFSFGDGKGMARLPNQPQVCRMFYNHKTCKYGDRCRFRHVNAERGKEVSGQFKDISGINIMPAGSTGDNRSGFGQSELKRLVNSRSPCDQMNPKQEMGKTKLCRNWEMTGSCLYGKICKFSHGNADLQKLEDDNWQGTWSVPTNVSNTIATAKDQTETASKQKVLGVGHESNRKTLEKMRGIYADWIEDMPLVHSS